MRVFMIPDKFKGSLTAPAAARALRRGWLQKRPQDEVTALPMSDGGEGFGEVIGRTTGCVRRTVETLDAAHRPCRADWWWNSAQKTAVIESASVIGLARLPEGKYHPFELDTFGLAAVLRAAAGRAAEHCLLGIGGSATNDGGFGLARGLGWRFLNSRGLEITRWTELGRLVRVIEPESRPWPRRVEVAVDVQNRLLGPAGATRIYGPQKGLRARDFRRAEACLRRLASVMSEFLGADVAVEPGTGAAGGLGFGVQAFLNARLVSGYGLFAKQVDLRSALREADLVITGEGSIDRSTVMGKGVGELAAQCRRASVPCIGIGGSVSHELKSGAFQRLVALTDLTSETKARSHPEKWLSRAVAQVAQDFVGPT